MFLSLPDAAAYLRDATLTIAAFVSCLPAAAAPLLQPGQGALLGSLAQAHDRLLPLLARVFGQPGVGKADGDAMMARLGQVGGTWHVACGTPAVGGSWTCGEQRWGSSRFNKGDPLQQLQQPWPLDLVTGIPSLPR